MGWYSHFNLGTKIATFVAFSHFTVKLNKLIKKHLFPSSPAGALHQELLKKTRGESLNTERNLLLHKMRTSSFRFE